MGFFLNPFRFAAGLTYLLRTAFSGATPDTVLDNAQALDSAAEGLLVGSGTVYDTAANWNLGLDTSGLYSNDGTINNAGFGDLGVDWGAVTRAEGRIIKASLALSDVASAEKYSPFLLLTNDATAPAATARIYQLLIGRLASASVAFAYGFNPAGTQVSPITIPFNDLEANTLYPVAIVLRSVGCFFFAKINSQWQLLSVFDLNSDATLYLNTSWYTSTTTTDISRLGYLAVTETLYPNLVQTVAEDDFSGISGQPVVGSVADSGQVWLLVGNADGAGTTGEWRFNASGQAQMTNLTGTSHSADNIAVDTGLADVLIVADLTTPGSTVNAPYIGFAVRCNGADMYQAGGDGTFIYFLVGSGSGTNGQIVEYKDGVGAVRASSTGVYASQNTLYNSQCRVVGGSINVNFGSACTMSASLANSYAETKHGISGRVANNATTGARVDNFKVYPAIAKQVSSTTVAEDDFSEADGTAIVGKGLDVGATWLLSNENGSGGNTGVTTVVSGKANIVASGTAGTYYSRNFVTETSKSDVFVTADVVLVAKDTYGAPILIVRSDTDFTQNSIFAWVITGTSQTQGIYERNAGVQTLRASTTATVTNGSSHVAKMRCVASRVEFSLGTSFAIAATVVGLTGTKCGFGLTDDVGAVAGSTLDNFKVYPFTELYDYDKVLDAI